MNVAEFYRTEPTGSQAYGASRDGGKRTHTGDDYSHSTHPDTVDVPAIRAGRVTGIQRDSKALGNGYGNQVTVTHDDGSRFTYGHLGRITVALGEQVTAGTIVGTEGTTGWTDGPCVHVEYFTARGARSDPRPHVAAAMTTSNPAPTINTNPNPKEYPDMYIANVSHGAVKGQFLVTPQGAEKPTALGLGGGANHSGFPVVDINNFSDAFWQTVRLV